MILTIAGVILITILILCFFNIKLGAALYLAYSLLVPIADITIGPVYLGMNFVKTILLVALLYDFKVRHNYKLYWQLMMPFVLYYVIELLIIPFQTETPTGEMYNSWRVSVMSTLFGAFIVYNVLAKYPNSIKLFRRSLLVSIIIAGLYGLFLTTLPGGLNPYINLIALSKGSVIDAETLMDYFAADEGGRVFGRISSVFMHPMNFGLFIGLSFVYVYSIRHSIKKWLLITLLLILSFDALFCGVRSCLGGLAVAISCYLIFSRNLKVGVAALFIGLIAYNLILKMPELSDYLGSIVATGDRESDVSGSSIDLRMDQLNGCLSEIRNSPILGKGYGWDSWYKSNFGDHPVILFFESLIFVVLCDNGFVGILIWILLISAIIRNNHHLHLRDTIIADSLLVFYLAYACITGEYGYMQYYLLFYICLVFENQEMNPKRYNHIKKNI